MRKRLLLVTHEGTRPLPRPADRENQPAAGPLQVEVGPSFGAVGGASAVGGESIARARPERPLVRLIALRRAPITFVAVEHELTLTPSFELRIQRLDVLQDRRVRLPGILEINRPFSRREIADTPPPRSGPPGRFADRSRSNVCSERNSSSFFRVLVFGQEASRCVRTLPAINKRDRELAGARDRRGASAPRGYRATAYRPATAPARRLTPPLRPPSRIGPSRCRRPRRSTSSQKLFAPPRSTFTSRPAVP